jgi:hypothetical protein
MLTIMQLRYQHNFYKLKCTIKQNIIIMIERKVKDDWWDALGLALIQRQC